MNVLKNALRDLVQIEPVFLGRGSVHPVLREFREECRAITVRLMAYVGGFAALAMIAADVLSQAPPPAAAPNAPAMTASWMRDVRPRPAFSLESSDLSDKTATYDILRHPAGGRKDVLRWGNADAAPSASLILYRPGGEARSDADSEAILGEITALVPGSVQPLGVIDTKFGAVRLLGATEAGGGHPCLGVLKTFSDPDFRLSGLFCSGDSAPLARTQVVCALNRLTLLGAGSDSRLAKLFARADLRSADCKTAMASVASADWMSAMADPKLRGGL